MFAVSKVSRKSQKPTQNEWINVIKIIKYLKGTKNYGLKFTNNPLIKTFADADFAGDKESRRSTSGYIITIGNTPISWYSKLQNCVSTSTAESEYYSISECAKQCIWYQNLLNELNQNINQIIIYTDNKAAIHISKNNLINPKSKHIDIRYHYIRELINKRKIILTYIKSQENIADGFTKYLNKKI